MPFEFVVLKMNVPSMLWQNRGVTVYPPKINALSSFPVHSDLIGDASAVGKCAAFECGTVIEIRLKIEPNTKRIEQVAYKSNGCGFMVAAAERLASNYQSTSLTDLHGTEEIAMTLTADFPDLPNERSHCNSTVIEAFRNALAEYRTKCVEEFHGEKALICTCFGIDEERIVSIIAKDNITDVSGVAAACNAGRGCGSCRMLIQELIDSARHEDPQ